MDATFGGLHIHVHLSIYLLGETGQGLPIQERELGEHSVLAENFDTLAEIFHAEGYRTYGWTGNPQLWSGLHAGRRCCAVRKLTRNAPYPQTR